MWKSLIIGAIKLSFFLVEEIIKSRQSQRIKNEELTKEKTKVLQSGVRALVDLDVSRLNSAIVDANRLRKK